MPMVDVENPMYSPYIIDMEYSRKYCTQCHARIHNDDLVYTLDGEIFCSEDCLIKYLGAKVTHGWELN